MKGRPSVWFFMLPTLSLLFIKQIPLGFLLLPSGILRNKKSINLAHIRPRSAMQPKQARQSPALQAAGRELPPFVVEISKDMGKMMVGMHGEDPLPRRFAEEIIVSQHTEILAADTPGHLRVKETDQQTDACPALNGTHGAGNGFQWDTSPAKNWITDRAAMLKLQKVRLLQPSPKLFCNQWAHPDQTSTTHCFCVFLPSASPWKKLTMGGELCYIKKRMRR